MKFKILLITVCILEAGVQQSHGQNTQVAQTLQSIYRNYDSVRYLSFDVQFDYTSDTLLGKFDAEQMKGTYTLAGKKAKYSLGDIDFMQNDSFFIAVYNRDKLLIVDEPRAANTGNQLPMRQQIDSLLLNYSQQYTINNYLLNADTGVIQFVRADSTAQFDLFNIFYEESSKLMTRVTYDYKEHAGLDSAVLATLMSDPAWTGDPLVTKRFSIRFQNYRFDNYDESVYDIGNYIWFDNGLCRPVEKYADYRIYYNRPQKVFHEEIDNQ